MPPHLNNTVYNLTCTAANAAGSGPVSSPPTLFYQCSPYFKDTGAGCQVEFRTTLGRVKHSYIPAQLFLWSGAQLHHLPSPAVQRGRHWVCQEERRQLQLPNLQQRFCAHDCWRLRCGAY